MPDAEVRQFGVGLPRGEHGHPARQDRVHPDGRPVTGAHQRVGDQAAGPQAGGGAGREETPRGALQGAGLQPRGGGGGHGLANAGAADGGGQGDPADGGGPVLAPGHRPADRDRLAHRGPGVRAAFAVVAGEQVLPRLPGEHVGDLPGEVVGVAQPGRQALADERRGEVGGIAEEKDAPGLEAGGDPGAEGVAGTADDFQAGQVAATGPGPQQPGEGVRRDQACFVLAVAQLELPAVLVPGYLHEGGGPGGVTDLLHAVPGIQAGAGADVDDQPSFGEAEIVHGDADQFPYGAAGAVAAQHCRPGERPRNPGDTSMHPDRCTGKRAEGAVQPEHLAPAAEADQRVLRDPGEQQLFQVGLVEHVRLREAVLAGPPVAAELGHDPVPGIQQAQPAAGPGSGQESVADADPVQGPGELVVQVHRPREGMGFGVAFQDGDGDPEVGKQEGGGAADRADADDDDGLPGTGMRLTATVLVVRRRCSLSRQGRSAHVRRVGCDTQRAVSGNPTTASRTRAGSAPATVMASLPSSRAAVISLAGATPAAASASVTARTAASAASAGL
jgi:hypothetical protein